jgi:hypothetical protein
MAVDHVTEVLEDVALRPAKGPLPRGLPPYVLRILRRADGRAVFHASMSRLAGLDEPGDG